MNYQYYTVSDFILDKNFREWVRSPDPANTRFWENWLLQHPEKQEIVEEARELLLSLSTSEDELHGFEEKQMWSVISRQIDDDEEKKPKQKVLPLHSTLYYREAKKKKFWTDARVSLVAASVLIFVALGTAYFFSVSSTVQEPVSVAVIKENSWGQRSTIYLSDGTEVMLNAGSRLQYDKDFSSSERVVVLEGEAFFDVAKDSLRPFKVRTGDITTQALGTSFNVKAYSDKQVEVALVSGKVSVQKGLTASADSLHLIPGESAAYDSATGLLKTYFDPKKVLSWKEGIIYFDHASENTVISTLEKWYGVTITLENTSAKEWNYTASFDRPSLEHVLMSIGFAMDFEYEIKQKDISIRYK